MSQGFFESDEDYRSRMTQEANERVIEESTGSAPSQGWFESDEDYRSRISQEASERIIGDSTGSAPSQGWFESDDDYRTRVSREANERIIEDSTGSAPTQGWFESDNDYRSRLRQEAHERIIEGSTGSSPSQGWFETQGEYRRRITLEARENRAKGKDSVKATDDRGTGSSIDARDNTGNSPSSASSSSASSNGLGAFFLVLLVAAGIAVAIWSKATKEAGKRSTPSRTPAPIASAAPDQIIDRGACPYEGCRYDERWMAKQGVDLYVSHPARVGTGESSLQRQTTVHANEWVRTVTGVVLAGRHDGRVDLENLRTSYGAAVVNGPLLRHGQVVPLYSYLGEGCWTGWIEGRFPVICGTEEVGDRQPQNEWWVQVRTADGSLGWTKPATEAFVSEESLNSRLGEKIMDSTITLSEKLTQVSELIEGGADLNGSGGQYGTTPIEAAIRTKDVDLMRSLLSLGLDLHGRSGAAPQINPSGSLLAQGINIQGGAACPAFAATQVALDPGGDAMLEFLLENGVDFNCLGEPPLTAFLRFGIATEEYPVDRAVRIAEILAKNGALVSQKDSRGRSILDVLDHDLPAEARNRVAALKEALVKISVNQDPSSGGGVGTGTGSGGESSSDGGFGGGAFRIGVGVAAPVAIFKIEPEYSEEARQAKLQGTVLLAIVVDEGGKVANVRVVRTLGMGLDEKSIEAVKKWRFRPGVKDGRAVPVMANVEVNFRLL